MEVRLEIRNGGVDAYATIGAGTVQLDGLTALVIAELARAGVSNLDEKRIRTRLAEGAQQAILGSSWEVLVAQGEPAKNGTDAYLEFFFPITDTPLAEGADPLVVYAANVVYPGDIILKKTPAAKGLAGRTLFGASTPAANGMDIPVKSGAGASDDGSMLLRSETYGVALYHEGRLTVVPAIKVSEDGMEARMTILPDAKRVPRAQFERIMKALSDLGIRYGTKEEELFDAVVTCSSKKSLLADVVVASGKPPADGRDAEYRLTFDPKKRSCKALEGERVDYLEMETVKNVSKGEILAEHTPAKQPEPGYRVDGTPLKAGFQRSVSSLSPGENTVLSEDGTNVLADADGMILLKDGKFHVVDEYVIPGDVDLGTGNIRASGSVRVRGQVNPGLLIQAGGEVEVAQDVCKSTIDSKGNIRVRGAITDGSRILAGKNVAARYVQNSQIDSGGDVYIGLSVTGSDIYARGKFRVSGPGIILGGEVNAAQGIEACTIGAPSSRTRVIVGVNLREAQEMDEIKAERNSITDLLRALQSDLGRGFMADPRRALLALPPALRKTKLAALQKMQGLRAREAELTARAEELSKTLTEVKDATIIVSGEIHAGTMVTIGRAKSVLNETLRRVVLMNDPNSNCVVWRRL